MNNFRWVFCRNLCHSFNFVKMGFVVKIIFSLLNSTGKFTFIGSLQQNFFISFFNLP